MTTVHVPDHKRSTAEVFRNIFDFAVPVLLTAVIVSLILFRVDVTKQFHQTAVTVQQTACAAVKASNDANYDLWERQIAASPQAGDPAAVAFLADIKTTNGRIYTKCLVTGGTASTR